MQTLYCASMAHVIDRAVAFRFLGYPYRTFSVSPNGVTLVRGLDMIRIEVKAQ